MRQDTADRTPSRRPRLTYANVAATLALVIAVGGGGAAYAAGRINGATIMPKTIPGSALRDATVGGAKIGANAITSAKVADGSLLAKDFAKGQLPATTLGTYAESVGVDTAVAANLVTFAATDSYEAPLWSGAWFGPVSVPKNGAWMATAAVEVRTTTPTNDMTCLLESKVGAGTYSERARSYVAGGTANLRFTAPFIRFAPPTAATAPEQFRVRCATNGPAFERTVTEARLTLVGAFRAY